MISYAILAIFWTALIYAALSRGPMIIYLFFASFAFGTLAMIPTQFTAGVTLLPSPIAALGLLVWALRKRGSVSNLLRVAFSPTGMLGLLLFTATAVASAIFLPRIFAGQVYVTPMRVADVGLHLLRPTAQNITQAAYICISFLAALAIFAAARLSPKSIFPAILVAGCLLVATGLIDGLIGNTALLDPFRTASYALNTHHRIAGMERIVGLMTEASAFGTTCMSFAGLLYFLRPALASSAHQERLSYLIALALLAMAVASASSTAILMLGLFGVLAVLSGFYSITIKRRAIGRKQMMSGLILGTFLIAGVIFVVAFTPDALTPAYQVFEELILNKTSSKSFAGRSSWNSTAWAAFLDTYGLGVGLGSARTSSWPIAVISNTGIFGTLFLVIFLLQVFLLHGNRENNALQRALNGAKLVLLLNFAGLTIAATQADFGLISATIIGLIIAWSQLGVYASSPGREGSTARTRSQVMLASARI